MARIVTLTSRHVPTTGDVPGAGPVVSHPATRTIAKATAAAASARLNVCFIISRAPYTGYLWSGAVAPHAIVRPVTAGADYTGAALEAIRAGAQLAVLWEYGIIAAADGAPVAARMVAHYSAGAAAEAGAVAKYL